MKQFLLLLFVSSFSCGLPAQTLSGVVTDAGTSRPMGYVSVGIEGTATGTVADKDGNYTLKLRPEHASDTVCFSHIGYAPARFPVSELVSMQAADVSLQPVAYVIEDVVVTPAKWRRRTVGNDFRSSIMSTANRDNSPGFEYGSLFKFKKRAQLESIEITVRDCTYDSLLFRINVYERPAGGSNFVNILTKPVYSRIERTDYSESGMTSITIDVTDFNIVAEGNTLVTFEYIETGRPGIISFPVGFIGNKSYFRFSSQDTWERQALSFPIKVTALVER